MIEESRNSKIQKAELAQLSLCNILTDHICNNKDPLLLYDLMTQLGQIFRTTPRAHLAFQGPSTFRARAFWALVYRFAGDQRARPFLPVIYGLIRQHKRTAQVPLGGTQHTLKVNKRLGSAKHFLQHEGNGFRSWQLTLEEQIPLLLYGFRLSSTIGI